MNQNGRPTLNEGMALLIYTSSALIVFTCFVDRVAVGKLRSVETVQLPLLCPVLAVREAAPPAPPLPHRVDRGDLQLQ